MKIEESVENDVIEAFDKINVEIEKIGTINESNPIWATDEDGCDFVDGFYDEIVIYCDIDATKYDNDTLIKIYDIANSFCYAYNGNNTDYWWKYDSLYDVSIRLELSDEFCEYVNTNVS